VLHHHEGPALGLSHVVHGHDRRMREPARRHRLLMKPLTKSDARLLQRHELGAQNLQGHQTVELGIVRLVDDAARATAELREKLVTTAELRRPLRRSPRGGPGLVDHRMSSLNVNRMPPITTSSPSRKVACRVGSLLTRMR